MATTIFVQRCCVFQHLHLSKNGYCITAQTHPQNLYVMPHSHSHTFSFSMFYSYILSADRFQKFKYAKNVPKQVGLILYNFRIKVCAKRDTLHLLRYERPLEKEGDNQFRLSINMPPHTYNPPLGWVLC